VSEPEDIDVCREYGMTHLTYPNIPVSEKWNYGTEHVRTLGCEYMIVSGSDDVFSTAALSSLIDHMNKGIDLMGFNDIYVYDTDGDHRGELIHVTSKSLGVGRTIHRRVLDAVEWRPWEYGTGRNWGMDSILWKNISPHIRTKAVAQGVIVDCKSHMNINGFSMFKRNYKGRAESNSIFYNFLSKEELEILHSIKQTTIPKFPRVHKRGRTLI
jgi:hypothetical protein